MRLAAALAAALACAGCGNKGPLYLPDDTPAGVGAEATEAAGPDAAEDGDEAAEREREDGPGGAP